MHSRGLPCRRPDPRIWSVSWPYQWEWCGQCLQQMLARQQWPLPTSHAGSRGQLHICWGLAPFGWHHSAGKGDQLQVWCWRQHMVGQTTSPPSTHGPMTLRWDHHRTDGEQNFRVHVCTMQHRGESLCAAWLFCWLWQIFHHCFPHRPADCPERMSLQALQHVWLGDLLPLEGWIHDMRAPKGLEGISPTGDGWICYCYHAGHWAWAPVQLVGSTGSVAAQMNHLSC